MTPLTPKGSGIFLPFAAMVFFLISGFFEPATAAPAAKPSDTAEMILIPEGYFAMGNTSSPAAPDEAPVHHVFVSTFLIDKHEVSNARYAEFMKATGHPAPAFWDNESFNKPDQPVVGVSWFDASAYAKWRGGRLPTEAEWEKAARGKDQRLFPWGNKGDKGTRLNFLNLFGLADSFPHTAPVTAFPAGAGPYGTLNMAGNVWEWCLDWYRRDFYNISPEVNPVGPTEDRASQMKVLRGGSWANGLDSARATHRARNYPQAKNNTYGFRIVKPAS